VGYCIPIPEPIIGDSESHYRDSVYRQVLEEGVLTLSCYFAYNQNSFAIDYDLENNQDELSRLDRFIGAAFLDSGLYVKQVALTGFCSIEGPYAVNERIARNRVQSFSRYLDLRYDLSEHIPVKLSWVPEDWNLLYSLVLDSQIDGREEVLRTIEGVDVFRGREEQIAKIKGGAVYRQLSKEFFPRLRRVEIRVEYDLQRMLEHTFERYMSLEEFEQVLEEERRKVRYEVWEEMPRIDTIVTYANGKFEIQGLGEIHTITHTEEHPLCYLCFPKWGVKTNLMHLIGFSQGTEYTTPLLNLSVEYFLNRHVSFEAGVGYSNWKHTNGKEFQGLSTYRLEPRYWLPHTISYSCIYGGAYMQVGDFNFRTLKPDSDRETYKQTGHYFEAGLSAGCQIPLGMNWGLDIGLRGGYQWNKAKGYETTTEGNVFEYDRSSNRWRLSAVVLALTYRWGYK